MAALAKRFVDRGVVVPLTYNDAYMGANYATGEIGQCEEGEEEGGEGGSHGKGRCGVELYGVDSYPQVSAEIPSHESHRLLLTSGLTAQIPTYGTQSLQLITTST